METDTQDVRFGLKPEYIKQFANVFRAFPAIETVKIYGSRAMGNYEPQSDIDLAVFPTGAMNIQSLRDVLQELPTPYLFDVTDMSSLTHEGLKEHIDIYGKTIYQK